MKVRVLKKHRCHAVGSTYEVKKEKDLKLLMKLGLIVPVVEQSKPKPQPQKKEPVKKTTPKRTYQRKDMQAEQTAKIIEKPVKTKSSPSTDNDTKKQADE